MDNSIKIADSLSTLRTQPIADNYQGRQSRIGAGHGLADHFKFLPGWLETAGTDGRHISHGFDSE